MHLDDFQATIARTYGERDRARGQAATVAWLCEELGELAQAVRKGTVDQQRHELSDVLAWLASLAHQLDLSLEDAAAPLRRRLPALRHHPLQPAPAVSVSGQASSAATSSAIWTALRAAPLRRLSFERNRARPLGTVSSTRMRPT